MEAETIRLGGLGPLTGDGAVYGVPIQKIVEYTIDEINAEGGINGKMIEIIYEDDQCDTKLAVSAFQKLAGSDDVNVVIGPTCSSNVLAVAPLANEKKVIVLTTVASTSKITEAGDYIFRNTPSGRDISDRIAEFSYSNLGARTASILFLNLANGVAFKDAFAERFAELGGEILIAEAYEKEDADFRTQLTKIKAQDPDVLFIAGQINHGIAVRQARELGIEAQITGPTTMQTPDFITTAGSAAEGVIYSVPKFDREDPAVKAFEEKYQARYGDKTLGFRTAISYDAVMIVAGLLEECGEDVGCIKAGLYATKDYRGVSGLTGFDENGDVIKPLAIKTVRDGEFAEY